MKKIIVTAGVIIILLAGLLVVAPSFIDWTKYRPFIVSRLHDATGYNYEIGGAFELRAVPYPRLAIENLSVLAPGHADKPLLVLKHADVSVALLPLLTGKIIIKSLTLDEPKIRLDVTADGTQSWMTPALKAKLNGVTATSDKEKQGPAIALNDITIKEGSFIYADAGSAKTTALDKINLTLHADTLNGPFSAEGTVVYNDKTAQLKIDADRFEGGADSIAVKLTGDLPTLSTKITYSGAVGLRGDHEIQGETDIETVSLKKLAAFAGHDNLPAVFDKPFSATGLLTSSADELSYKNTKFVLAGATFTGRVGVTNLKAAGGKPIVLDIGLAAEKAVDLNKFIPSAAQSDKSDLKDDESDAQAKGFLPTSLTLPAHLTATVILTAPAMHYKDTDLTNAEIDGSWKDQKASGGIKAVLPDSGNLDVAFGLLPGTVLPSAAGDSITLSDLALSYTLNLKTSDGQKTAALFLPADKVKNLDILAGAASLAASGMVKSDVIDVTQGTLALSGATANVSGSYTPKKAGGRNFIRLVASANKIDLDQWINRFTPPAPPVGANNATAKEALKQKTQKLALPFDLDLSLAATNVKFKDVTYDKLGLMILLVDKKMTLKTLQAQDQKGNNLLAAGSIGDITTLKDIDLSVQGRTNDLKKMIVGFAPKMTGLPDTLTTNGEIVAEVKGQTEAMDFTANVKAMGGTLDATGTVNNLFDKPDFTGLTVRLKHPNYVDVVRLFNPAFHGSVSIGKTLDLFASMKREKSVYSFTDLQGTVGPATFSGDVTADVSGTIPTIKAKLQMGDVALDKLIGNDSMMQGAVQAQREGSLSTGGGSHWSREPLNADVLRKFNLDLTASAKSLSYNAWQISNASAILALKDGTVDVTGITGTMYGGKTSLQGKVVSSDKPHQPLTVSGKVDLQDVSLQTFVTAFSGAKLVKADGNISVNADITTTGASPADLIAALDGTGKSSGKNIVFNGFDLARLSRTLTQPSSSIQDNISALVGSTMGSGSTSFDKLESAFMIKQGIIKIDPLNLTGTAANVASPGTINLPLWTIDMESTITLNGAKDAPPLKVAIKGPLDQPAKAFGKSALDAYVGGKVQKMLTKVLQKNGLVPATGGAASSTAVQATTLVPPGSTPDPAVAAPATTPATAAPATTSPPVTDATLAPAPAAIKPKDAFKALLKGVVQEQ